MVTDVIDYIGSIWTTATIAEQTKESAAKKSEIEWNKTLNESVWDAACDYRYELWLQRDDRERIHG